jgi:hypothetical protein
LDGINFYSHLYSPAFTWYANAFFSYDGTISSEQKLINNTVPVITAVDTIESIADPAKTGFTGLEQSYAQVIVDNKIPSLISEYEFHLRKAHTVLTYLCSGFGITPPSAFPTLSTVFYTAFQQLSSVRTDLESIDFSSCPTPTDAHFLDVLNALSNNFSEALTGSDSICSRLTTIFVMYSAVL